MRLVYESGGAAQSPWIYESVRVVPRDGFERCVVVTRRGQAERESCARGDTLFERRPSGEYAAVRPIGPNMELEVRSAAGNVVHYSTGPAASVGIHGLTVAYVPTTIVTRDAAGSVTRRLREQYAPALLTALWGVFEEPGPAGGWSAVREFSLARIEPPEPAAHRIDYRLTPPDTLLARIEGQRDGQPRGLDVPLRRIACPVAASLGHTTPGQAGGGS